MKSESQSFKENRAAAILPYAALCAGLLMVYILTKVEIVNRPPLQPAAPAESRGQAPQAEPPPSPMEGKPVPDFDLPTLAGGRMKLADLRGKVLFINIWATWCAPCREEMPSMQKLYQELKGPDFEMVGISIDKDGTKSVAPFVSQLGLTFPVLLDPNSETAAKFMITGVPETYLVGRDGTILHHLIGPTDWSKPVIVQALKALIGKSPAGGANRQG